MFPREAHDIDLFVKYVVAPGGRAYAAAGREYHGPLVLWDLVAQWEAWEAREGSEGLCSRRASPYILMLPSFTYPLQNKGIQKITPETALLPVL